LTFWGNPDRIISSVGKTPKGKNMFNQLMIVVGFLLFVVAIGLMVSFPAMLLWNSCLVPAVTILNDVTWMQMWGIIILCTILFKSFSVNTQSS